MAQGRCIALVALVASILAAVCTAQDHNLGAWNLARKKEDYKAWAATETFLFLSVFLSCSTEFEYNGGHNVWELANQAAYNSCDVSSPIKTYNDPNPIITLGAPGKHFYVCGVGNGQHCLGGMKVIINVVSSDNAAAPGPGQNGASGAFVSALAVLGALAAVVLAVF